MPGPIRPAGTPRVEPVLPVQRTKSVPDKPKDPPEGGKPNEDDRKPPVPPETVAANVEGPQGCGYVIWKIYQAFTGATEPPAWMKGNDPPKPEPPKDEDPPTSVDIRA